MEKLHLNLRGAMTGARKYLLPNPGTIILVLLLLWAQSVGALPGLAPASPSSTVPNLINYQGRLTDNAGNAVPDGNYDIVFSLYHQETGGTAFWSESRTAANGSAVPVAGGLFHVLLGQLTTLNAADFTGDVWLGVKVGTDAEMTPRERLASVPFAMQSDIPAGSVTTAKIADGAVTQVKLGSDVSLVPPDGSITTQKIADGAVTQTKAPTLIKSLNSLDRVEYGIGNLTGSWGQNPAAGVWYRITNVTFATPFTSVPAVFVDVTDQHPATWAKVKDISTNGFSAVQLAVFNPGSADSSFNWLAIGH